MVQIYHDSDEGIVIETHVHVDDEDPEEDDDKPRAGGVVIDW